jgi:archaemetzincin
MSGVLQLALVGQGPKNMLRDVAQAITEAYRIPGVSGAPLTHPQYALNPQRQQFHATAILRRLSAQLLPEQLGILGICDVDLFTPEAEFVYGEADRELKAALISLQRLKMGASPAQLTRRAQTEAVHEMGYLLGLSHCEESHCVMFLSRSTADTDRKGLSLCNDCKHELQRLNKL